MSDEIPSSVTARRMLLGVRLRRLREARRITRSAAGYTIRASESKISRLELGRISVKERDVADLLVLYGVIDPVERSAVLQLARDANRPQWWREYEDVVPGWFQDYIGLEQAASAIRTYETHFVPGLLQTDEYSRAVIACRLPTPEATALERAVALRSRRKRLLTRPRAPKIRAIIDEGALRRPVGSEQIRRDQLQHLLVLTNSPLLKLQILPIERSVHAAGCGAFTTLQFTEPDLPDIVYVEHLLGALYIDRGDHTDRYTQVYERLSELSLNPDETTAYLTDLAAETDRPHTNFGDLDSRHPSSPESAATGRRPGPDR